MCFAQVRFSVEESVKSKSQIKSSLQRNIRNRILEQYPSLTPLIDELLPKKTPMIVAKWYFPLVYSQRMPFFKVLFSWNLDLIVKAPDGFSPMELLKDIRSIGRRAQLSHFKIYIYALFPPPDQFLGS